MGIPGKKILARLVCFFLSAMVDSGLVGTETHAEDLQTREKQSRGADQEGPEQQQEGPKIPSWAEKVVNGGSLKRKMQLVYHQPDSSEEMVMMVPPQDVIEDGARDWE